MPLLPHRWEAMPTKQKINNKNVVKLMSGSLGRTHVRTQSPDSKWAHPFLPAGMIRTHGYHNMQNTRNDSMYWEIQKQRDMSP